MSGRNPVLIPLNSSEKEVEITHTEFMIGRSRTADLDLKHLGVSRTHCIFRYTNEWMICDKSSSGTFLNKKRLEPHTDVSVADKDQLELNSGIDVVFIFCTGGQNCPNACSSMRQQKVNSGLDAEFQQRRRVFEYQASLKTSGIEQSLLDKQRDKRKLAHEQQQLNKTFSKQIIDLEQRFGEKERELLKSLSSAELINAKRLLEAQLLRDRQCLEEKHAKETVALADKIQACYAAEEELRKQNEELQKCLATEKEQFEKRLEEERKLLEAKLQEQLAEQQRLVAEKAEVEAALQLRIESLKKEADQEEEQHQQQLEMLQKQEEEKIELEKRLKALESSLKKKEEQEKEREAALFQRERELQAQEEERERERRERDELREAEFRAKEREFQERDLERERERKAELERLAEERERDIQLARLQEHSRLQEELNEREQQMRQQLMSEIAKLESEKQDIEQRIRGELSKEQGENAEVVKKLTHELDQVKQDLSTTSTKRSVLEKELEDASKALQAASQSDIKASQAVINNFGELVETELQCSICSELFVVATTLNCNHTYCRLCISDWLKKKHNCPICRAAVTQQSHSLVLDNFIDKMVENLSDELKARRKSIVEERKALEKASQQPGNSKKRKRVEPNGQVQPPPLRNNHQVHVLHDGTVRILNVVPLTSVPQGARPIQLNPIATTSNSFVRLPTVQSTSQLRTTNPVVVAQLRPQQLQMPYPHLVRPSSSAPNRTIRIRLPVQQQQVIPAPVMARPTGATMAQRQHNPTGQV